MENYATMVDPEKMYPVSYIVKQDGTKIHENNFLLGKDLTENQIKQLVHFESSSLDNNDRGVRYPSVRDVYFKWDGKTLIQVTIPKSASGQTDV